MSTIREKTIAIDNCTHWCFIKLVRAYNAKREERDEVNSTVDALASDILMQFIKANHPKLLEQWTKYAAIGDETDELLKAGKI